MKININANTACTIINLAIITLVLTMIITLKAWQPIFGLFFMHSTSRENNKENDNEKDTQ